MKVNFIKGLFIHIIIELRWGKEKSSKCMAISNSGAALSLLGPKGQRVKIF